jgi:hypothetical protein
MELQVTVNSFIICTPRQIMWDNTTKKATLGRVSYMTLTGYVKKSGNPEQVKPLGRSWRG